MIDQITPVVLTFDEEANIGRTLEHLAWAREVIVVDSLSKDATTTIARSFPNVRILERPMDDLASQSEFGIAHVRSAWAMLLDADYVLPPGFVDELRGLDVPEDVSAYIAPFAYAVNGRILRGSLYPPRIVLLRKGRTRVWQDGHAHRVQADGRVARLASAIVHDDRKSFGRFVQRQRTYMRQEATKLRNTRWRDLPLSGRIRKLVIAAPLAAPLHALFVKGLVLDGLAGARYAAERLVAELILSAELLRGPRS